VKIKTSRSDPLQIDGVTLAEGGVIGMTLCPGKNRGKR